MPFPSTSCTRRRRSWAYARAGAARPHFPPRIPHRQARVRGAAAGTCKCAAHIQPAAGLIKRQGGDSSVHAAPSGLHAEARVPRDDEARGVLSFPSLEAALRLHPTPSHGPAPCTPSLCPSPLCPSPSGPSLCPRPRAPWWASPPASLRRVKPPATYSSRPLPNRPRSRPPSAARPAHHARHTATVGRPCRRFAFLLRRASTAGARHSLTCEDEAESSSAAAE